MKLPPIPDPGKYVGLYVYDFGDRVSVGYTAAEVRVLREFEAHRGGTAYEIYRVTEAGGFELRAAEDARLASREAICLLRSDADAARRDYDAIREAAEREALPCPGQLELAKLDDFDPPHVTALSYSAAASPALSAWLQRCGCQLGDRATGGIDAHAKLVGSGGLRVAKCQLPTLNDHTDRSAEQVLAAVDKALQR